MLNILIPTKPNDIQALYVHAALQQKGHRSLLWYTGDFPAQQTHSFELLGEHIAWHSLGIDFEIKNDDFDVVWFRRPTKPTLSDSVHHEDIKNAQKESDMLFQTLWQVIAPNAMWVNSPDRARAANSKLLQLKAAAEAGLQVPRAIISNDPNRIKKFIASLGSKGIICKTLHPLVWQGEEDIRSAYTAEIDPKNLPSDHVLKIAPCIFQEKIEKAYELRITYFGNYPVTVKLKSQEHPKGFMDWRCIPTEELLVEEYQLPDAIDRQCRIFMEKLGIVFGCFDFIVTPENQYYFLEVNESGQFLWIEGINPSIKMLDVFTEFLIKKSTHFKWVKRPDSISLSDFEEEIKMLLDKNQKQHLKPVNF